MMEEKYQQNNPTKTKPIKPKKYLPKLFIIPFLIQLISFSIYTVIALLSTLDFSVRESLIMATMCLISHNFVVETIVLQKTAYEIYRCDWSSDVCSSDLSVAPPVTEKRQPAKYGRLALFPERMDAHFRRRNRMRAASARRTRLPAARHTLAVAARPS